MKISKSILLPMLFLTVFSMEANAGWEDFISNAFATTKKACIWCDKSLSELKMEFKESLSTFDKQKSQVSSEFAETKNLVFSFAGLLKKSKNENIVFGELHDKWEISKEEINELQSKFIELVESADSYFLEAEKHANTINDAKLKNDALYIIKLKKKKYISLLKQSRSSLDRLQLVIIKVKDVMTFLEINYSLKSLDDELEDRFSEIDKMISIVMKDLDVLSLESQELLSEI